MDITEYYLDDEYDNIYNDIHNEFSHFDIWKRHILNCSYGIFDSLYPLFLSIIQFTFIQRLLLSFDGYISRKLIDFLIGLLGILFLFYKNVHITTIVCVLLYFWASSMIIRIFRTYPYLGPIFILFSLISTILCEYIVDSKIFLTFRGSWMVMIMKMISLSFDIHDREMDDVNIFQMFGYIFNPSTYFFGLFISYKRYQNMKSFKSFSNDLSNLLLSGGYLMISVISVFYSDCLLELIDDYDIQLINDYKTAQSFRFGHYFVNYFLWSTAILGGIQTTDFHVINARKIELPRSMEEVVSFWNIPMHEFLHKYVYLKTKTISKPIAVALTFLTSALMHGLNFQISSVLISLALFALSESLFRQKLADKFNLCIKSRTCKECKHKNSKFTVFVINFLFSSMNIILLIYLGMPFDNNQNAEIGYSMKHTLNHWRRWNFAGHLISFVMLILRFFI